MSSASHQLHENDQEIVNKETIDESEQEDTFIFIEKKSLEVSRIPKTLQTEREIV